MLGPIFRALGFKTSPFVEQKQKGAYVWRDMERLSRKYGLDWKTPSVFPRSGVLAARIATFGAEQPWLEAFCQEVMRLNFVRDEEIATPEQMTKVLQGLGLPAAEILAQAQSEPNKALLREATDEALRRGVFGAPTFFVGDEMFWGNDRLEDALDFAAERIRP